MKTEVVCIIAVAALAACAPHAPRPETRAPVAFVHLFEWRWPDVARECEDHLGPGGYSAVQVSPPQEHITGPAWWTRYQPVSYKIHSRGGTRAEFEEMVSRCRAAGIAVYADAIINHMAGLAGGIGVAGSEYSEYDYVVPYGFDDFHHCGLTAGDRIEDYQDLAQVRTCQLGTLDDLDTGKPAVQARLAAYLNDLLRLGVAGFRIDAAKHIHEDELHAILRKVEYHEFRYLEVIDRGGEPIDAADYLRDGMVTEFKYASVIVDAFERGNLDALTALGQRPGWLPPAQAVVFVDNHDIQRGHAGGAEIVNYKDGATYDLAVAFMLAHPYGYPLVMSSYTFDDGDQGPPEVSPHEPAACGTKWVCEHRRQSTLAMLEFRRATLGEALTHWQLGEHTIAFGRGAKGHVFINTGDDAVEIVTPTRLPAGSYTDIIHNFPVTVGPDGTATLSLSRISAAAILAVER